MGSITITGFGPGSPEHRTKAAESAIRSADLVVGYELYLDMVADLIGGTERYGSSMMEEAERADYAIGAARSGRRVAVVASGDACVYGIGGLVLERMTERDLETIPVTVVPGITAANAAAALLGSPLMNDYMVLSLSDLLTERELILRRAEAAGAGDLALVLYNPRSRTRRDLILLVRELLLRYRPAATPAAVVRHALRGDERIIRTTLGDLEHRMEEIDMSSVVVVGSSRTVCRGDFFVTPRGYAEKYGPRKEPS